jgi:hypothetical protein
MTPPACGMRSGVMPMRHGSSLAELVVAMTVGGLLSALLFGLLSSQLRLARETPDRIDVADAVRVTSHVVAGEVRRMAPPDLRALSRDSMAIRAYRGAAIVCARDGEHLGVRFRGDRLRRILPRIPFWSCLRSPQNVPCVCSISVMRRPTCVAKPGETLMSWTVQPAIDMASVLLIFESGTYYLTAGALRYRLGAEGRQPVTTELFLPPFTRFVAGPRRPGSVLPWPRSRTRHFHIPVYFGTVAAVTGALQIRQGVALAAAIVVLVLIECVIAGMVHCVMIERRSFGERRARAARCDSPQPALPLQRQPRGRPPWIP